jgi:putative endonuclease
LENPKGKFYVGQTGNLAERLKDHNRSDSFEGHFTRKNGPWKLVWFEEHELRSSAMQRERHIKRMKSSTWIRKHLLAQASAVNPRPVGIVGSSPTCGANFF